MSDKFYDSCALPGLLRGFSTPPLLLRWQYSNRLLTVKMRDRKQKEFCNNARIVYEIKLINCENAF